MGSCGFCIMFFMVVFFAVMSNSDGALIAHVARPVVDYGRVAAQVTNRKLKETVKNNNSIVNNKNWGNINQEDYPRFDPSPSSKAAIHSGPIEHSTPLMPFVPQPTPPAHPRHAQRP